MNSNISLLSTMVSIINMESVNFSAANDSSIPNYDLPPPPPMMLVDRLYNFKRYAYPVTTAFGVIGNTIIFYIFTRTKLKKPSTARYLAATAIADLGYLITTFLVNLTLYDIPLVNNVGPCQLLTFGNYVFLFLSTWYLVAVMVEKYIGVSWPRNKSRMCTVFRAKCVIIFLAVLALVCYLYITWFYGVVPPTLVCTIFSSDIGLVQAWQTLSRIDAIVNFAIPYIIIVVMTCLIGYHTWVYRRRSRSAGERFLRRTKITNPEDKEFKTTPLLILLASCTLIFCTPNNTSSLRHVFLTNYRPTETDIYIFGVFHYLHMLNNSIKIIVYIAASNAFVRELGKQFCRIRNVLKRSDANELQNCHHNSADMSKAKSVNITEGNV